MKIKKQVVSAEIAKKLKENGANFETGQSWYVPIKDIDKEAFIFASDHVEFLGIETEEFPAPTTAELLEILHGFRICLHEQGSRWEAFKSGPEYRCVGEKPQDALAEVLIKLQNEAEMINLEEIK